MVKFRYRAILGLTVILFLFGILCSMLTMTSAKAEVISPVIDGKRIASSDEVQLNTLTIPLAGMKAYVPTSEHTQFTNIFPCETWGRSKEKEIGVIITFPNVTHKSIGNKSMVMIGYTYASLPRRVWNINEDANRVEFTRDVIFNIPDGYFNLLHYKDNDPKVFTISLYYDGYAYNVYQTYAAANLAGDRINNTAWWDVGVSDLEKDGTTFTADVTTTSKLVPSTYNDPDSDDFVLGNSTGLAPVAEEKPRGFLYSFYEFLCGVFGWKTEYKTFLVWFWVVVFIILFAFVGLPIINQIRKNL